MKSKKQDSGNLGKLLSELGEKYPGHFDNDPAPQRNISLKVQFEDCRAAGITVAKCRKTDPKFAALYEEYLRKNPRPRD